MDNKSWLVNRNRFLKKLKYMDCNFCTTHPSSLITLKNKKTFYIPNPVDKSFENLDLFKKKNHQYDLFFALSHGVHRGSLKKGKLTIESIF